MIATSIDPILQANRKRPEQRRRWKVDKWKGDPELIKCSYANLASLSAANELQEPTQPPCPSPSLWSFPFSHICTSSFLSPSPQLLTPSLSPLGHSRCSLPVIQESVLQTTLLIASSSSLYQTFSCMNVRLDRKARFVKR